MKRMWRITFTLQLVLPAQPPMNINSNRMARQRPFHWSKSLVPNPVLVWIETTWNTP